MLIIERHQHLLSILRTSGTAQLEDLARQLGVSASTVRRDLEQLEARGLVERTRAGAIYREPTAAEPAIALARRMNENVAAKEAIARVAGDLVQPHMTVLLDGGSTVVYAARRIRARPIQVVTNSLHIANHFSDDDQVELLLVGGSLYPRTGVLVGAIATGCLADLHADLLLFSLAGIYEHEAFNINLPMAEAEQVMMQQAARSVLLMDASKFGRKSLVRVCGVDEVDQVIADANLDIAWRERFADRVVVAPLAAEG